MCVLDFDETANCVRFAQCCNMWNFGILYFCIVFLIWLIVIVNMYRMKRNQHVLCIIAHSFEALGTCVVCLSSSFILSRVKPLACFEVMQRDNAQLASGIVMHIQWAKSLSSGIGDCAWCSRFLRYV